MTGHTNLVAKIIRRNSKWLKITTHQKTVITHQTRTHQTKMHPETHQIRIHMEKMHTIRMHRTKTHMIKMRKTRILIITEMKTVSIRKKFSGQDVQTHVLFWGLHTI